MIVRKGRKKELTNIERNTQYKENLKEMGYGNNVLMDEIQAYLQYGHDDEDFSRDIPKKIVKIHHQFFRKYLTRE